jgi:hypothetical protein
MNSYVAAFVLYVLHVLLVDLDLASTSTGTIRYLASIRAMLLDPLRV